MPGGHRPWRRPRSGARWPRAPSTWRARARGAGCARGPRARSPGSPSPELGEAVIAAALDLRVRAEARRLDGPPAQELRAVTKAAAREVIVTDLAHEPWRQRLPLRVASSAPATGTAGSAAGEARRLDERLQHGLERAALGHGEARAEADVVQQSGVVVEPEEQRADLAARLRVAEAAHHAVDRAHALDLAHGRSLPGRVGRVRALGHNAVEPARAELGEPATRQRTVGGDGGEPQRPIRRHVREELLEPSPPLREGQRGEIATGVVHERIEDEIGHRRLAREFPHTALGRMDALQEGVEVEPPVAGDDDLPVEDDAPERQRAQRGNELGKVARESLCAIRLEHDALALTKGEAAEAIPLRLERPLLAGRQRVHRERLHRRVRRPDGQVERGEVDGRLHRAPVYAGCRWANREGVAERHGLAGTRRTLAD